MLRISAPNDRGGGAGGERVQRKKASKARNGWKKR